MRVVKATIDTKVDYTNDFKRFQDRIRDKTWAGRAKYIREKYEWLFGSFEGLGDPELLAMKIEYEMNYRALVQNNIPMSDRFLTNYNAVKLLPLQKEELTDKSFDKLADSTKSLYKIVLTTETETIMENGKKVIKALKEKGPSIRVTACNLIVQRKFTNEEILKQIQETHEGTGCSAACLAWYRNKLNKGEFADYKQPKTDEPYGAIRAKKEVQEVLAKDVKKAVAKTSKVKDEAAPAARKVRKAE